MGIQRDCRPESHLSCLPPMRQTQGSDWETYCILMRSHDAFGVLTLGASWRWGQQFSVKPAKENWIRLQLWSPRRQVPPHWCDGAARVRGSTNGITRPKRDMHIHFSWHPKSLTCDEPLDRIDVHGAQRPKTLSSLFCVDVQTSLWKTFHCTSCQLHRLLRCGCFQRSAIGRENGKLAATRHHTSVDQWFSNPKTGPMIRRHTTGAWASFRPEVQPGLAPNDSWCWQNLIQCCSDPFSERGGLALIFLCSCTCLFPHHAFNLNFTTVCHTSHCSFLHTFFDLSRGWAEPQSATADNVDSFHDRSGLKCSASTSTRVATSEMTTPSL